MRWEEMVQKQEWETINFLGFLVCVMWEKWAEKKLSSGECQGFIEVEEVEAAFSEETARRRGP